MKDMGNARQRIIHAAVNILNSEGACGITTRRIAEEAGVNSAALNYYYGSRDNLVDHALNRILEHIIRDWEIILGLEELDIPVRIYCLLDYTMESTLKYPCAARSLLFDPLVKEATRRTFAEKTGSILDMLSATLGEPVLQTMKSLRLSLGQMLLTVISGAMVPELFTAVTEEDITAGHSRSRFILHLLRQFLGMELTTTDIVQSDIIRVRRLAFTSE